MMSLEQASSGSWENCKSNVTWFEIPPKGWNIKHRLDSGCIVNKSREKRPLVWRPVPADTWHIWLFFIKMAWISVSQPVINNDKAHH